MKVLAAASALAMLFASVMAGDATACAHPFDIKDLVMMQRVGSPQLSPDGRYALYSLRSTDYAANRGVTAIYVQDLQGLGEPRKLLDKGSDPRWAPNGRSIYYMAPAKDVTQLWRLDLTKGKQGLELGHLGTPRQLSHSTLDLGGYRLSPDGQQVLLSYEVYRDCQTLACTQARLDERAKSKASGTVYHKLFVRHWDTWANGRRNQLFISAFGVDGVLPSEPRLLSRGIDGDVPSKPSGDMSEVNFSPDGRTVYFGARIAGNSEPWSTNFDVFRVPADGSRTPEDLTSENNAWDAWPVPSPDGQTLYYLAMREPGFETDRLGIMALDLVSGQKREVDPAWDRSAGDLGISNDGKTLYATADDQGQHPLFAIDVGTGEVQNLTGAGTVSAYSLAASQLLIARNDLKHADDLYLTDAKGSALKQVTHYNAQIFKDARMGDFEFFTFPGWHGETVQGYVMKPANYQQGKQYPVAFIIHGGPQAAMENGWSYRWNPQTYAGQGFAVVTVNFHGSTGYGQAFTDSISGDWGGKPLEDLKLGWSAALAKYPFLDSKRACALGASYGGFMIYWIAGVWNQPWRCLVDHDGVFDTRSMYYSTEELWFEEKENGGPEYAYPGNYQKFNPLEHAQDWRVPMLVIHGGRDFRIPDVQGLSAFTLMQRRGIPSEFLYFPDENHWVLKPQNSVMWHETVNAWLKQWTAAPAAADSAQH